MTFLIIIFFAWFIAPASEDFDKDAKRNFIFEKTINLKISGSQKDGYKLKGRAQVNKILNADNDQIQPFEIIHDEVYSSIKKLKANINGSRIKGDNIGVFTHKSTDEFFSDNKTRYIKIPDTVKKGDTLSYSYQEEFDYLAYPSSIFIPNLDSINSFVININHPKEVAVDFFVDMLQDSLEYHITRTDEKNARFSITPTAGSIEKPYFNFNSVLAAITITIKAPSDDTDYNSPEGFVKWYGQLTDMRPKFGNFRDTLLLNSINEIENNDEQIAFILKYVQDNFRYIAIGRPYHAITPFSPDFVFNNKYGDCKDRSAVVAALADLVGLDVYMSLINTKSLRKIKAVHPGLFNHVICCYINNGDTVFFDPTSTYTSYPYLPENLIGRQTLVIKENPFIKTLTREQAPYSLKVVINSHIDSLKNSSARFYLRNFYKTEVCQNINNIDNIEIQNHFNGLISSQFSKLKFSDFSLDSISKHEAVIDAQVDLSKVIIKSPNKTYLPKTIFSIYDPEIKKRANDTLPLHFEAYKDFICQIELSGISGQLSGDSLIIDYDKAGYYKTVANMKEKSLSASYHYLRPNKRLNNTSKIEHLKFLEEHKKHKTDMFKITNGSKP